MADFLTPAWFDDLNATLLAAGPVPVESGAPLRRVVLEFSGGPSALPHAMTFTAGADGASVAPGDHLAAHTIVRLSYNDALALFVGSLDSAGALREGRVKIRGDVNAVVPLLSWLQRAHPHAES